MFEALLNRNLFQFSRELFLQQLGYTSPWFEKTMLPWSSIEILLYAHQSQTSTIPMTFNYSINPSIHPSITCIHPSFHPKKNTTYIIAVFFPPNRYTKEVSPFNKKSPPASPSSPNGRPKLRRHGNSPAAPWALNWKRWDSALNRHVRPSNWPSHRHPEDG